jgi:hypothetical protein
MIVPRMIEPRLLNPLYMNWFPDSLVTMHHPPGVQLWATADIGAISSVTKTLGTTTLDDLMAELNNSNQTISICIKTVNNRAASHGGV